MWERERKERGGGEERVREKQDDREMKKKKKKKKREKKKRPRSGAVNHRWLRATSVDQEPGCFIPFGSESGFQHQRLAVGGKTSNVRQLGQKLF